MQRKRIYVPAIGLPMDLNGNKTLDVSFVDKIPATKIPGVIYYVVDGKAARLTNGNSGHITWRDDENRVFDDKKYFRPISNADVVINPALKQNPRW